MIKIPLSLKQAAFSAVLSWALLFNFATSALTESELARSKEWLRVLHYKPNWYWRNRSLVDGKGYFFAPDGKYNPESELRASIAAMQQDIKVGKFNLHPQCAFPFRYRFLKRHFPNIAKDVPCPKVEEFLAQFQNPKAVSLVFSSAYPNNPASMFGHTFLRIHSERGTDLLDQGLNFAAASPPGQESTAEFYWFGLTGGYPGQWSSLPYYVKVNEYINGDSRDIWDYELSLSREETYDLLYHLWELETNSFFEYYFFDENCSYQILGALEAIRPDWDLLNFTLGLIPGESVKNVMFTPNAVRQVRFRPSLSHQFSNVYNSLNKDERKIFLQIIKKQRDPKQIQSRPVLDATINYLDYASYELRKEYKQELEHYRKEILVHRATLGPSTPEEIARVPALQGDTRPDFGHDAYRIHLGQGYRDAGVQNESFTTLTLKSPYHDLLNNDLGYTRYAHIEFPFIELQYNHRSSQIQVNQLSLLATTSLVPYSQFDKKHSWKVETGYYLARDYECLTCGHWYLEAGLGLSLPLGQPRNIVYSLGLIRPEFSSDVNNGYRILPGLELGILLNPWRAYKMRLSGTGYYNLDNKQDSTQITNVKWDHSFFLLRNLELRQSNSLQFSDVSAKTHTETKLEVLFFFK